MAHRARSEGAVQEAERSGGATSGRVHPDRERRIFSRANDTPIRNRGQRDERNTTAGRGQNEKKTEEVLLNDFRALVIEGASFSKVRKAVEAYFRTYLRGIREPKTTLN